MKLTAVVLLGFAISMVHSDACSFYDLEGLDDFVSFDVEVTTLADQKKLVASVTAECLVDDGAEGDIDEIVALCDSEEKVWCPSKLSCDKPLEECPQNDELIEDIANEVDALDKAIESN